MAHNRHRLTIRYDAEPGVVVDRCDRRCFPDDLRFGRRVQMAVAKPVHVDREHVADTVRVNSTEVGVQQRVGSLLGIGAWHADTFEDVLDRGAHRGLIDSNCDVVRNSESLDRHARNLLRGMMW